ncbi:hypothetical protein EJ03DRAFT_359405 [Teratosphaeria nubilosa]|uniref:Zn(2)-C6 fungal-type domain-containing protein n=1 Tax=Teratosphaeria nubilosa TaxID=161662 RepID=A0A6G1LE22_9PEZI|nr:hypothetical protein EJ03DRAFT_359405 [Teratosphaeria nubilosa]
MEQNIRVRIGNACDNCKARKVRCDGQTPCGYCCKRQKPLICTYSPQKRRRKAHNEPSAAVHVGSAYSTTASATPQGHPTHEGLPIAGVASRHSAPHASLSEAADEPTDVDLAGRLVKDAHGKLVFIGDCAPLSFYQSVRRLLSNTVDTANLSHHQSRASLVQNQSAAANPDSGHPPPVRVEDIHDHVQAYQSLTTSLVDLFGGSDLSKALISWARHGIHSGLSSAVFYLVLANGASGIGDNHRAAQDYFEYAKSQALYGLGGDLSIETVQAFILITLYLLKACQTNAAFVFLGIAARAAYAVGIHRTEANAMFGEAMGRQRGQIWKSLRAVDLFLSTSMGRPPATSDVDCTVPYSSLHEHHEERCDMLNAQVQILLIVEDVVLEVYSRKKITLAITEGLSGQLRDWSNRWLRRLQQVLSSASIQDEAQTNGACQVICSYYYAVMLVSRPFLMYEACRRLSDQQHNSTHGVNKIDSSSPGKAKLADACIDSASMLVDTAQKLIDRQTVSRSMPLIISWLFASSLALGLGLLCGFGRILERYGRTCVTALDYFAKTDSLAVHYSLIGRSLVDLAVEYLEQQEVRERRMRTESSSQLFGLIQSCAQNDQDEATRAIQTPAHTSSYTSGPRSSQPQNAIHQQDDIGAAHLDARNHVQDIDGGLEHPPLDLSLFDGLFDDMSPTDWSGINLFPVLENAPQVDFSQFL